MGETIEGVRQGLPYAHTPMVEIWHAVSLEDIGPPEAFNRDGSEDVQGGDEDGATVAIFLQHPAVAYRLLESAQPRDGFEREKLARRRFAANAARTDKRVARGPARAARLDFLESLSVNFCGKPHVLRKSFQNMRALADHRSHPPDVSAAIERIARGVWYLDHTPARLRGAVCAAVKERIGQARLASRLRHFIT